MPRIWSNQSSFVGTPNPVRQLHSMAYDPIRKTLVLFGGLYGATNLSDTWELENFSRWVQRSPTTIPPARCAAMMGFNPETERIVLFGGYAGTTLVSNDIYEWDGLNWTLISPDGIGPGGRSFTKCSWTAGPSGFFFFGGWNAANLAVDETWSLGYDRQMGRYRWNQWSPVSSPLARSNHSFVYLPNDNSFFMFGGFKGPMADTWLYNASSEQWVELFPTLNPPARYNHSLFVVYPGTAEEAVYLFGGFSTVRLNDLWRFFPSMIAPPNWVQVNESILNPQARQSFGAVWIPDIKQTVLFAGDGSPLQDTWNLIEDSIDSITLTLGLPTLSLDGFAAFRGEMGFYPEV